MEKNVKYENRLINQHLIEKDFLPKSFHKKEFIVFLKKENSKKASKGSFNKKSELKSEHARKL